MSKIRVGIVFGGKSTEHEISLLSARNIINAIDRDKYELTLLGIDKQGQWHVQQLDHYLEHPEKASAVALSPSPSKIAVIPGQQQQQLLDCNQGKALEQVDVIFPIVHGTLGEDGSLQGLLRMVDLPFVGSSVLGSAVCMDKDVTKRLLRDAGLPVTPFATLTLANRDQIKFDALVKELGLPLFIKPANQGSSVGVSKVKDEAGFKAAVQLAFEYDHKVLVESTIVGREIECAVLGNEHPRASVCGEIAVDSGFYSYDAKYIDEQGVHLAIPAQLPDAISEHIRQLAVKAFQTLDCLGLARVDVFLTQDERILINEVNNLPGFTDISMYPNLWQASGISHTELIGTLIELALQRHRQNSQLKNSAEH